MYFFACSVITWEWLIYMFYKNKMFSLVAFALLRFHYRLYATMLQQCACSHTKLGDTSPTCVSAHKWKWYIPARHWLNTPDPGKQHRFQRKDSWKTWNSCLTRNVSALAADGTSASQVQSVTHYVCFVSQMNWSHGDMATVRACRCRPGSICLPKYCFIFIILILIVYKFVLRDMGVLQVRTSFSMKFLVLSSWNWSYYRYDLKRQQFFSSKCSCLN